MDDAGEEPQLTFVKRQNGGKKWDLGGFNSGMVVGAGQADFEYLQEQQKKSSGVFTHISV